jgi:hypothetical protein
MDKYLTAESIKARQNKTEDWLRGKLLTVAAVENQRMRDTFAIKGNSDPMEVAQRSRRAGSNGGRRRWAIKAGENAHNGS